MYFKNYHQHFQDVKSNEGKKILNFCQKNFISYYLELFILLNLKKITYELKKQTNKLHLKNRRRALFIHIDQKFCCHPF